CAFPTDKGLFAVTPDAMNGGWAMAPDQECVSGTWCPIACPPGQVMAQWKPGTTYAFPESTYGGVYCNDDGEIEVPFKNKPWCVDGTGAVEAVNKAGKVVSFCQTCLPGYEDMIIPTDVEDSATLAVPGASYWDSTAAHYYINAPGVDSSQGCHWGDKSKPIGNWSPYVAGANTVEGGSTFVKLGLNPVWQDSPLYNTKPNFGLKVECPDGNCNGAKCEVDGNGVVSDNKATGAGGSDFCVVTVPPGSKAHIVVYNLDGSGGDAE
ncbi:glycoside hydrolase family 132 protein, partial [Hypoxylon sp. EC38]